MLIYKVKHILLENEAAQTRPYNMTQLAASLDISHKHLLHLIKQGRSQDIERIAKGLDVNPSQLNQEIPNARRNRLD